MKHYKHYIIYQITNLVNNKIYIGKHKCDRLDDNYFGSGKILHQAISKYGQDKFVFHLLIDLANQEEMDLLEELVVNKSFLERDDVYNISRGGVNPCMYGSKNPFFNKTHSKEFCESVSARLKNVPLTQQHKDRIRESVRNMLANNPEIRTKLATRKGKCQCRNKITGQIKFFYRNEIPEEFEPYRKIDIKHYKTAEEKELIRLKLSENASKSRWFNNGDKETFCLSESAPPGFKLGRLPGLNVGRIVSKETRLKMREAHIGKPCKIKGRVWITDGINNTYLEKGAKLPDGWTYGMTRH